MKTNQAFAGKKIYLISDDETVVQNVKQAVTPHAAIFFHSRDPKDAVVNVLTKNPDLVIYDEEIPPFNGLPVLTWIKQKRPQGRVLFLSVHAVPLRSIDVNARGVSSSIQKHTAPQMLYNAIKHCLAIASVPRIEEVAI